MPAVFAAPARRPPLHRFAPDLPWPGALLWGRRNPPAPSFVPSFVPPFVPPFAPPFAPFVPPLSRRSPRRLLPCRGSCPPCRRGARTPEKLFRMCLVFFKIGTPEPHFS